MVTRKDIISNAAAKMRAEFDELALIKHGPSKGTEAENILREFLRAYLPKRFDVGAGFVIDPRDRLSKQCDAIIYDAFNCPVPRMSDVAGIYPSDNVAAIVSVKSSLDKNALEEAFGNVASVKSLAKSEGGLQVRKLVSSDGKFEQEEGKKSSRKQTFGVVFGFSSPITLNKLAEHYLGALLKQGSIGHHPDLVVVLDQGFITLSLRPPFEKNWSLAVLESIPQNEPTEGFHIGVSACPTDRDTLYAFLSLLLPNLIVYPEIVPHPGFHWSELPGAGKFLTHYLTSVTIEKDPIKRQEKLAQYRKEVQEEFRKGATEGQ